MGAAVPILTRVIEEKLAVTVDHYGGQIKDLSNTVFHPVVILFFSKFPSFLFLKDVPSWKTFSHHLYYPYQFMTYIYIFG